MAEVVLSTDDLTVLGGPVTRNVEINIGAEGVRGSRIFIGNGNPNSFTFNQEVIVFDLYINLLPSDTEYLYLYQYVVQDGVAQWIRILRLVPNTFLTTVLEQSFVGGVANYFLPIINVVPLTEVGNITEQNFNVQYTILNDKPTSSSLTVGNLTFASGIAVLPITLNAVEFDVPTSTWSPITDNKAIQMLVTIA